MLLLLDGVGWLFSLSIIVKSLSSAFWAFCGDVVVSDGTGGLDFYGLKLFLSGTLWFHLCIQLCSCQLGISSGRLYQFSCGIWNWIFLMHE